MVKKVDIRQNRYYDSVKLMAINQGVNALNGVREAVVLMGTPHNKEILARVGLDLPETQTAGPGDLIIALEMEEEGVWEEAREYIEQQLTTQATGTGVYRPRSLEGALKNFGGANVALISLPGEYAGAEAHKALDRGLHVMLFSDHVSLEEEIALKAKAGEKGLLMMGPDCGTAMINGVPLGFANAIRRGKVGIVAAAGTGAQEVSCLLHRQGLGVSQILGTGGRDVQDAVGGAMMLRCLRALEADPGTEIILLVSKPPGPQVEKRVEEAVSHCKKPVVMVFLGGRTHDPTQRAQTLEEGVDKVLTLLGQGEESIHDPEGEREWARSILKNSPPMHREQRYLRGLFTGGTLCYEALLILSCTLGPVYSNTPLKKELSLAEDLKSRGHTCLDLGEDRFTRGRAHPMIDPTVRLERIQQEVEEGSMAVLLLDVVLGYGAHADMAASLQPVLEEAQRTYGRRGGHLHVVASVCGTSEDPQNYEEQKEKLLEMGIQVAQSNAQAARLAACICRNLSE